MNDILTEILVYLPGIMLNVGIFVWLCLREKKKEQKKQVAKPEEISIIGQTKTRITPVNSEFVNKSEQKQVVLPKPTEEPDDDSPEIGEEFHPETDEIDEEEIELEELFAITKEDIRLDASSLVTREIATLQKISGKEQIAKEDKDEVESAIAKLDGSEFLRMFRENEEKAEKRNRELLKLLELEENKQYIPTKEAIMASENDVSLEDFL